MHARIPLVLIALCATAACAPAPAQRAAPDPAAPAAARGSVDRDTARIRAATARFRSIEAAAAAGYARTVRACVEHQPHGAMGFHHANQSLWDATLEIERPEILVYSHAPDGSYKLNGVEYIVPYTAVPRNAEPPTIMGQQLKPSDQLTLWYLHVWVWEPNPSGLFADWNPAVTCPKKDG